MILIYTFTELTKTLHSFLNGFCPAYVEGLIPSEIYNPDTSVTEQVKMPYLTYSLSSASYFEEGALQIRVWSRSNSLVEVSRLTDKILNTITEEGIVLPVGKEGYLWIYKGNPVVQFMPQEEELIKCNYINLTYRLS